MEKDVLEIGAGSDDIKPESGLGSRIAGNKYYKKVALAIGGVGLATGLVACGGGQGDSANANLANPTSSVPAVVPASAVSVVVSASAVPATSVVSLALTLPAPLGLSFNGSVLSWTAVPGATSYRVFNNSTLLDVCTNTITPTCDTVGKGIALDNLFVYPIANGVQGTPASIQIPIVAPLTPVLTLTGAICNSATGIVSWTQTGTPSGSTVSSTVQNTFNGANCTTISGNGANSCSIGVGGLFTGNVVNVTTTVTGTITPVTTQTTCL